MGHGVPEKAPAYAQLYLKEEIQAEALVRNLSGFARFLPIAAIYHGQVINVSNIAREAGVARTTVAGYLEILEETLICFRLPAFEAKMRVRERKLPKWCKGLRALANLKGLRRRIIVYPRGPVMRTEDGIDGMPFEYFAEQLAENSL